MCTWDRVAHDGSGVCPHRRQCGGLCFVRLWLRPGLVTCVSPPVTSFPRLPFGGVSAACSFWKLPPKLESAKLDWGEVISVRSRTSWVVGRRGCRGHCTAASVSGVEKAVWGQWALGLEEHNEPPPGRSLLPPPFPPGTGCLDTQLLIKAT